MADLTIAMKGVIQSSTARTSSTYASTDLIQLYDSNNAPTIKISKDDLMAAVKASLPSLLSDQGTSGTAFPSIASGVLGSMSAANLASVLGGTREMTLQSGDLNDFFETVRVTFGSQPTNRPSGASYGILQVIHADAYTAQIYYNGLGARTWLRINLNGQSSGWNSWQEVALNIPAFYKDYSTLAGLANGMGALIKRGFVSDFNDARELGIYLSWSANVPHAPITDSSIFYLIVISYSTDAILQLCYVQETHILYHRTYYVGTWTNWFAITNT